ncbi:MAG TPA: hypothetical protein VE983_08865, partial [Solirubrobacteraceae bacterium]|nr:hypothetical protein [Solirubrobacteraceae bacterium]
MTSQVKNLVAPVWRDLRSNKLWPVALGLLVAIVAVPVVLSTSSSPHSSGSGTLPVAGLPTRGLPAVSQSPGSGGTGLNGSARDPFAPQSGLGGGGTTTAA